MDETVRDTFIEGIDPRLAPAVLAIASAVRAADGEFDTRISYKMLMYALGGDFRHWVCAIGVTSKVVSLRFLYGALLEDPRGVLRAGSSHLSTIDFDPLEEVDAQLVTDYVNEAVAKHANAKAHDREL